MAPDPRPARWYTIAPPLTLVGLALGQRGFAHDAERGGRHPEVAARGLSQSLSADQEAGGLSWFSSWVPLGRSDPVRPFHRHFQTLRQALCERPVRAHGEPRRGVTCRVRWGQDGRFGLRVVEGERTPTGALPPGERSPWAGKGRPAARDL